MVYIATNLKTTWCQVSTLESYDDMLYAEHNLVFEETKKPVSQIDVDQVQALMHAVKEKVKTADADLKDAKRRVNGFKGPKKRKSVVPEDVSDESDGSVSAWGFTSHRMIPAVWLNNVEHNFCFQNCCFTAFDKSTVWSWDMCFSDGLPNA